MAYTMRVCKGENTERSVRGPSPAAIDQAIDGLIPEMFHYAVLEADPPLENCIYIQTLIEREGRAKGCYLIEARYVFDDRFQHYRKHARDAGEVKRLFRAFTEDVAPNTAGWEEITERMHAVTA